MARLMRKSGIRAKQKRRFKLTTNSKHNRPVASNVLDREFEVKELDSVWAGDITYVPTAEGWLYLAAALDLCSRRVVGWAMDKRLTGALAISALNMALAQRTPVVGLFINPTAADNTARQVTGPCWIITASRPA